VVGFADRFRPTYPGFPVGVAGVEQDHAVFFEGKPHARSWLVLLSRKSGQRWCEHGAPLRSSCGLFFKFRTEIWLEICRCAAGLRGRPAVSHISRKTSEMWGTRPLARGWSPKACWSGRPAGSLPRYSHTVFSPRLAART
jgi:hypothetical protein